MADYSTNERAVYRQYRINFSRDKAGLFVERVSQNIAVGGDDGAATPLMCGIPLGE